MKKYISLSDIFSPLIIIGWFGLMQMLLVASNQLSHLSRILLSVIAILVLFALYVPRANDFDFIGSSNYSVETYIKNLIVRNLWIGFVCFVISVSLMQLEYGTVLSAETAIYFFLMFASAVVIVGIRIQKYDIIILYLIGLAVGLLFQNTFYLIILSFVVIALSFRTYTQTLEECDLV